MAKKAKSVILDAPHGEFRVEEAELPELTVETAMLEVVLCGVCGTDVHIHGGHWEFDRFPINLGHEIAGRYHPADGRVASDLLGRAIGAGDLVGVVPGMPCGRCYSCQILREPGLCEQVTAFGFRPLLEAAPHFQGGFSDYVHLHNPDAILLKMDVPPEVAVLLEPLAVGMHFIERAEITLGDTVAIQGAGAIGLFSLAAARAAGAGKIIVLGAPASRLQVALAFGADVVIDLDQAPDAADRISRVKCETRGGLGADVVIECAGVPSAVPEGLDMLRRGGTYVEGGHFTNSGDVAINPYRHMVRKHAKIVGVWGSSARHFVRAHGLLHADLFPWERVVSHVVPLEQVGDAVAALSGTYRMDDRDIIKAAVGG